LDSELFVDPKNPNATPTQDPEHRRTYHGDTLYRIELKYGPLKWVIYRKTRDFVLLHSVLTARYLQGRLDRLPKFPSSIDYYLKRIYYRDHERMAVEIARRREELEDYLLQVMRTLKADVSEEISEFLELSALSIAPDQGWKGKEGYLDVYREGKGTKFHLRRSWKKRWVIIRDSYPLLICYMSSE
jgi:hypothetical protein